MLTAKDRLEALLFDDAVMEQVRSRPSMEHLACGRWERLLDAWCRGRYAFDPRYEPPAETELSNGGYSVTGGSNGISLRYNIRFERTRRPSQWGQCSGAPYAEDAFRQAVRLCYEMEQEWIAENYVGGLA